MVVREGVLIRNIETKPFRVTLPDKSRNNARPEQEY
jgi:hypothetical protein